MANLKNDQGPFYECASPLVRNLARSKVLEALEQRNKKAADEKAAPDPVQPAPEVEVESDEDAFQRRLATHLQSHIPVMTDEQAEAEALENERQFQRRKRHFESLVAQ